MNLVDHHLYEYQSPPKNRLRSQVTSRAHRLAEELRAHSLSDLEFSRRLYGTGSPQAHASVEPERAI